VRRTRTPLTIKRQQWAEQRGGAQFKGNILATNFAPADRYSARLKRLVAEMNAAYLREIRNLWKTDHAAAYFSMDASLASQARILLNSLQRRFAKLFASRAVGIVDQLMGGVDKASSATLHNSLKELSGGLSLKTTAPVGDIVTASTAENVALIKSIPQQYHDRITNLVLRSVQSGENGGLDFLTSEINRFGEVSAKRAEFIAVDQTRKITTAMNRERAVKAGIRKFEWIHSAGGAEPRKLHLRLNGQIFDYDNPPVIDERTGERGFPGQLINCRCTMRPIVDFGGDNDDGE